jgi:CcmD family protein
MRNKKFPCLLLFWMFLVTFPASAQVEMADKLRSEGKIYVVVSIILIVLAGVFVYLFLLDRKIKKLESMVREKEEQTK